MDLIKHEACMLPKIPFILKLPVKVSIKSQRTKTIDTPEACPVLSFLVRSLLPLHRYAFVTWTNEVFFILTFPGLPVWIWIFVLFNPLLTTTIMVLSRGKCDHMVSWLKILNGLILIQHKIQHMLYRPQASSWSGPCYMSRIFIHSSYHLFTGTFIFLRCL